MKFHKMPSIEQFRNVIRTIQTHSAYIGKDENNQPIYDYNKPKPTLKFVGSVKIHGTNLCIAYNKKDGFWFQSKNNIITVEKDNAGAAFFCQSRTNELNQIIQGIKIRFNIDDENNDICLYGEYAGGNIQKGVAVNGLDKFIAIFGLKICPHDENIPNYWINNFDFFELEKKNIFHINTFGNYEINIDFENPKLIQNKLIELTEQVEKECPVGKYFGRKFGEDCTAGEGIVWSCEYNDNVYRFKTKGSKHSSSHVKKLAKVDTEKLESISSFIEYAVTENRLNQAVENVFTMEDKIPDIKMTGDFIRWVVNDILKEEIDTMNDNNLEPKEVNGQISKKARDWFVNYLDNMIIGE